MKVTMFYDDRPEVAFILWCCPTELYYTDTFFCLFLHPIYINEGRLNDGHTSLQTATVRADCVRGSDIMT